MINNPMSAGGMNQLGSKSPNLQSPNASGLQVNVAQVSGMINSMPLSISNNGTQINSIASKCNMINIFF